MLPLAWKSRRVLMTLLLTAVSMITAPLASAQGAGAKVDDAPIPPGIDVFNLNLGQTKTKPPVGRNQETEYGKTCGVPIGGRRSPPKGVN